MSASVTVDDVWTEFVANRSPQLRDELINTYAPLVRFVVARLGIPATSMLEADDLVSYGMIGLINAIDRFDPARGVRFEAYATSRIRGAVIDQLRTLNWLPRSAVTRVRHIESTLATLEQRLGRPPKEEEVAIELGVSTERYRHMLHEVGISVLSLDAPLASVMQDDEVTSLGDLLEDSSATEPSEEAERHEMIELLSEAIDRLPERERLLLSLYYQEELTMKEISKVISVSESRVCQLHMQAVMRLRALMNVHSENHETKRAKHVPMHSASERQIRKQDRRVF